MFSDKNVDIITTEINCSMGKSLDWLKVPDITEENAAVLNEIGYGSVKNITTEEYLNSLENGNAYKVYKVRSYGANYTDQYIVITVKEKSLNKTM